MSDSSLQEILCCLGHPIAGNPMQFMMEKSLASLGLDWRYLTLEVRPEELESAIRGMKAMGFRGGNLFSPFYEASLPFIDSLSETAHRAQGVNCLHWEDGKIHGELTTGQAVVDSLPESIESSGSKALVVGSNSQARAIALALVEERAAEVYLVAEPCDALNLLLPKQQDAVQSASENLPEENERQNSDTPESGTGGPVDESRGMGSLQLLSDSDALAKIRDPEWAGEMSLWVMTESSDALSAVAAKHLLATPFKSGQVVADLTSFGFGSQLLERAQACDCQGMDGVRPFVRQANAALSLWSGCSASLEIMTEAVEEYLEL